MSRKRSHRFAGFLLLLLIAAGAAGFWAWQRYAGFAHQPLPDVEAGSSVVVEPGDSLPKVLRKLRAMGIDTGEAVQWRVLARQLDAAGKLQVGEYALDRGITPRVSPISQPGSIITMVFT